LANKDLKKIAFISDNDYSTYKFRMPLLRYLDRPDQEVYILVPTGDSTEKLKKGNLKVMTYEMIRKSVNPFRELGTLVQIFRTLKKIQPDVVHTFGIKPNVYGTLSARLLGTKYIINTVTGLGSFFVEEAPRKLSTLIIQTIMEILLNITFLFANKVIFLNEEDIEYLTSKTLKKDKTFMIKGEGIDIHYYSSENINEEDVKGLIDELKIDKSKIIITMVSRLIWFKGVREFCEAARHIKKMHDVEFLLIGNIDYGNPFAVDEAYLKDFVNDGTIRWPGFRTDIREILHISDVFVLPSYYREGLPISILEAMSMGKPVITANVPGCRQICKDGINGFLVQARDVNSLSGAIEKMILDEGLRKEIGKINREEVVKEFSIDTILNKMGELYNGILSGRKSPT
jgi:N,N'-diacetylbacillosaminyl-diphospho-undecaprenol alpha-1,3-N-acetylgalactosaminyltransferase